MKIVGVIPSHMASIRFPGKILFDIHGLPMIEHVRRRAMLSNKLDDVIVTTCDKEIADVIKSYGGKVIMTRDDHNNGTSRVAEAVDGIECSHIVLLQGDEPLLLPRHIDALVEKIIEDPQIEAWNATGLIEKIEDLDHHSFVKYAVSKQNFILYCFRRSPCYADFKEQQNFVRKILGIIAYKKDFLFEITKLPESEIEQVEYIEQMRIIENNYKLKSVSVSPSLPSINEPLDVDIVLNYIKENIEQQEILNKILNQY